MNAPLNPFKLHENSVIAGVPDGYAPFILADLVGDRDDKDTPLVFVARDAVRLSEIFEAAKIINSSLETLVLPAWDCLPYDRVSPNPAVASMRMAALAQIADAKSFKGKSVIGITVNAALQKMPSRDFMSARSWSAKPGQQVSMDALVAWAESNGFSRTTTVREHGEYAVRGGIVDLFVPGSHEPVRFDFFGDTLETLRGFDTETQRTTTQLRRIDLVPMSEIILNEDSIKAFRQGYAKRFGGAARDDALYFSISEGVRHAGMEHWLGLFHDTLETIFDYLPESPFLIDHLVDDAIRERSEQIVDHYRARKESMDENVAGAIPYKPLPPDMLYLGNEDWTTHLAGAQVSRMSAFREPESGIPVLEVTASNGRNFATERATTDVNIFDAAKTHIDERRKAGDRVVLACSSEGSRDRLVQVLSDHACENIAKAESWQEINDAPKHWIAAVLLDLEHGFERDGLTVISETDILGDRMVRRSGKGRKASDALTEASVLDAGDVIVHIEHGIGRFAGLTTITAAGAPHDCLELHYHGGDKLYLPVENIELLSRYGSADMEVELDRLGGVAWQSRKARLKKKLIEIADKLIATAAARLLRKAPIMDPPEGVYDEFTARFAYSETEDQLNAIEAVSEDLTSGRPMDRLVCGDVGFGKTEVALRAALLVGLSGFQVAVVVPTTLLCRQHYNTFKDRFKGLPVRVAEASRLVGSAQLSKTKKEIADGMIDIVIGTHALLGKSISFKHLGLLIIDEEQHFGVKHKERLKELRSDVHVLTLTATPIPRTLQLALTGVRDLSLIATPPVDRMAIRTFVSPFDPIVTREALLREKYRGGQSFYVCPRIADLAERKEFLDEHVPEVKVAVAHGQMPSGELDDIMTAFYDGHYDVLLSTTIIESGLDVPTANTLIVHRADMFGLSQLYQIRGRVGRSKIRAYALFTLPAKKKITPTAERRLKVLQSLETLGAGFQLASHDLDIRGSGNLLGEEQSGQVKEVGYELYQQMLEEAVASLKSGEDLEFDEKWSPSITVGMPVMIPEGYVPDLQLRMSLYRRLADLETAADIDAFGAELIDRFGPLPDSVEHLMRVVFVKGLCRRANVEKVDAGPKGLLISFRNNEFANPAALVAYVSEQGVLAKIKPDQKIVLMRDWPTAEKRLTGTAQILTKLVRLAEADQKAA